MDDEGGSDERMVVPASQSQLKWTMAAEQSGLLWLLAKNSFDYYVASSNPTLTLHT